VGRCAELCGTYHSMMNFEVRAVSPEDFQRWLAAKQDGASTPDALRAIGEAPFAVKTFPFETKREALDCGPCHEDRVQALRTDHRVPVRGLRRLRLVDLVRLADPHDRVDRRRRPAALRAADRDVRRLLLVRLAAHRSAPGGP